MAWAKPDAAAALFWDDELFDLIVMFMKLPLFTIGWFAAIEEFWADKG